MSKQDSISVNDLIVNRLDRIDSVLDKQNLLLDDIKRQTTLTNGRVTILERDIIDSKSDRREIHSIVGELQKNNYVNDGVRNALKEESKERQKTTQYWFTESRTIVFAILTILIGVITFLVGKYF